jgi:hypothetical protein
VPASRARLGSCTKMYGFGTPGEPGRQLQYILNYSGVIALVTL